MLKLDSSSTAHLKRAIPRKSIHFDEPKMLEERSAEVRKPVKFPLFYREASTASSTRIIKFPPKPKTPHSMKISEMLTASEFADDNLVVRASIFYS